MIEATTSTTTVAATIASTTIAGDNTATGADDTEAQTSESVVETTIAPTTTSRQAAEAAGAASEQAGGPDYHSSEAPPSGVAGVIDYWVGGGDIDSCPVSAVPMVVYAYTDAQGTVQLGGPLIVCAGGFDLDQPVSMLITGTDGGVIGEPSPEMTIDGEPHWFWRWYPPSWIEPGTIDLTITQGSTTASATAVVTAATARAIVWRSRDEPHFYGYRPNAEFRLFLFERGPLGIGEDVANFVAELSPIQTSSTGGSSHRLTPPPPSGREWCVLTEIDLTPAPGSPVCGS